jgi:hypothetical protein
MKIRPVGVEILHEDRQRTDRLTDKPNGANTVAAFHNFAKAPNQIRTTKMSFFFPEFDFGLRSNNDSPIRYKT